MDACWWIAADFAAGTGVAVFLCIVIVGVDYRRAVKITAGVPAVRAQNGGTQPFAAPYLVVVAGRTVPPSVAADIFSAASKAGGDHCCGRCLERRYPPFVTADRPSRGAIRTMPLAIVVPLAIAIISYHLMERPILQIKERLATQASPQTLCQNRRASAL